MVIWNEPSVVFVNKSLVKCYLHVHNKLAALVENRRMLYFDSGTAELPALTDSIGAEAVVVPTAEVSVCFCCIQFTRLDESPCKF